MVSEQIYAPTVHLRWYKHPNGRFVLQQLWTSEFTDYEPQWRDVAIYAPASKPKAG